MEQMRHFGRGYVEGMEYVSDIAVCNGFSFVCYCYDSRASLNDRDTF
jgi:hypothetical protein